MAVSFRHHPTTIPTVIEEWSISVRLEQRSGRRADQSAQAGQAQHVWAIRLQPAPSTVPARCLNQGDVSKGSKRDLGEAAEPGQFLEGVRVAGTWPPFTNSVEEPS